MSNLENTINNIVPFMTKGAILFGIILCLSSITIAIYSVVKEKKGVKKVRQYLICTLGMGAVISIAGLLVNYIVHFDIDFSSYRHSIPFGYIIFLVVFFSLRNIVKKTN